MKNLEGLYARAKALRLHGLLAHWSEAIAEPVLAKTGGWVEQMLDWEEQERHAEAWSAVSRKPISAASKPFATSIGHGPNAVIAPPSRR